MANAQDDDSLAIDIKMSYIENFLEGFCSPVLVILPCFNDRLKVFRAGKGEDIFEYRFHAVFDSPMDEFFKLLD